LVSRNGNEFKRFDDLCRSIANEIKVQTAVLDGEVVALNRFGMPAFYDLLKRQPPAVDAKILALNLLLHHEYAEVPEKHLCQANGQSGWAL
jgi:ATP-dependent DNA ligase